MVFSNLTENPPETTLITSILGILISQGLTTAELAVLGRITLYLGDAFVTLAILQTAHEAEKNDKVKQNEAAAKDYNATTSASNDDINILLDSILAIIKQLQQQNQDLQEQIWTLQEGMSLK